MLTQEQKNRLNPEQLKIAEKWIEEKEKVDHLFYAWADALSAGNFTEAETLLKEIEDTTPTMCEHDRSVWSSCAACEEIEKALNPEFYDENGDRLAEDEILEMLDKRSE